MLRIDDSLEIPGKELVFSAIRAPGPGGQNVNKVSSAVHLRFDIVHSAVLDDELKQRLLDLRDRRISRSGIVVIKSSRFRSQEKNKEYALSRLADLIRKGLVVPATRKKTRPSRSVQEKRRDEKSRRSRVKKLRRPPQS
ncbi:MAG: alternative ribosome rescue aminoacyl-tRNA hydrolase ArfB [Woeseiaceae bacterium]|nr:alternative ribosome rescue aminoacyl-tRNA hydrolase ArfB [Woeseiaceae bacterium]